MQAPRCISCNSDQTQTVKLMCESGMGTHAGLYGGDTTSELAGRFYPGPKPLAIGGIGLSLCLLALCAALISEDALGAGVGVGCLGVLIGAAALLYRSGQASIRRRKMPMYEHGWICKQCGASWIPKAGDAEALERVSD